MSHVTLLRLLLAAWAALLILGFAFGRLDQERINRIPRANKILSSAILVVCALIWWLAGASGTPLAAYAALLFFGMAFSFVGDVIMAQLLPLPQHVLFGMGAFGVAHALYISGYLRLGSMLGAGCGAGCPPYPGRGAVVDVDPLATDSRRAQLRLTGVRSAAGGDGRAGGEPGIAGGSLRATGAGCVVVSRLRRVPGVPVVSGGQIPLGGRLDMDDLHCGATAHRVLHGDGTADVVSRNPNAVIEFFSRRIY